MFPIKSMTGHDAFAAKSDFWAAYIKCRPEYPNRLFKIIYDYHSSHSQAENAWGVAHDIGSGVGIAALEISRRFSHVIVSDPSSSNIESAKEYLSIHKDDSNFSFHIAPAETVGALVEDRSVDLLASSEAIMWADHDESMNGAARMTKAGGTLAFWTYHARPYIHQWETKHNDLQEKLHAIYERFLHVIFDFIDFTIPHIHLMKNMDTWSLDPKVWTDVRRIHWNRLNIISPGFSELVRTGPYMPNAVNSSETVENYPEDILIRESVDYDWIERYYENLYPGIKPQIHLRDEMDALEKAFEGKGKVNLGFPATLLLATRR